MRKIATLLPKIGPRARAYIFHAGKMILGATFILSKCSRSRWHVVRVTEVQYLEKRNIWVLIHTITVER